MRIPGRSLQLMLAIALGGVFALSGTSHAQGLSPRQEAGQRVIYSYPGLTPPQSLLDRIRAGEAAGVIFFGENISGTAQISAVIRQLDDANAQSPVKAPLLLMTDQEGGQVRRLPGEPTLSEKQVGQAADPVAAATQAGTGAGQNLAGVGMNVNLAPVLDVYRADGDFLDHFGRSYSKDPAVAARLGQAFIGAQQRTGVAATAKHFPGLGSATRDQNTDAAPVTLDVPLPTLRDVDEAPYPAAFSAGVKLVMVSWATYPALDASHPAGLSGPVVRQELRQRLGFAGVTITDALEAGALQGTTGQRAVSAAAAGMDLILCSARDATQGDAASDALVSAVQSGQLDQADFTASVNRVTTLRTGL
ncbi:glycoside hydrolase family 3 N-terminal domain-containing protein [Amycolatopsis sp. GM8]|uniref:glycoside hydrolase family 3 N-terminal domain-containing protein n=1 Tax=Amycolatopsis sp. GM8 TaxID=2896530 RepID=UPI001F28080B|nr:glycoside hydrolase family 3 N-terminal domain-containing protein [Amycolatopsis sp. GM8]